MKKASSQALLWAVIPSALASQWLAAKDQHSGTAEVPGPGEMPEKARGDRQQTQLPNKKQLGKTQQIQPFSASYLPSYEKLCIYIVGNAAILVQGLKTENPQEGQLHGAEDQCLFLTALQPSCDMSAKLFTPTLLYPFLNLVDRRMKKRDFLSWITYLVLTTEDLFLRKVCLD